MKILHVLKTSVSVAVLCGCTIMDGNSIVTGATRSPIFPEQVKLYRTPPEKYEEIAIVDASAGHDFLKNSSLMNSAIQRLKEEAAKVGANGLLLTEMKERDAPAVTTTVGTATASAGGTGAFATGTGVGVNRGDSYTRLRGLAIYVP
jgi:hypothetical protein